MSIPIVHHNPKTGQFSVSLSGTSGEEFQAFLLALKSIPGRSYSKGCWVIPATEDASNALRCAGMEVPLLRPKDEQEWKHLPLDPSRCLEGLYPFQLDSLKFLIYRRGRGLIGDDMGTGKTIQALAFLKYYPAMRPALIVTTAPTKLQWAAQTLKWIGEKVTICNGQRPPEDWEPAGITIINWDILGHWTGTFKPASDGSIRLKADGPLAKMGYKVIIADECQAASDPGAKRTKALKALTRKAPGFVPMSGTPVRSRPRQFFPVLNMLDKEAFPNHWKFLHQYCDPQMGAYGMTFDGATNIGELHALTSPMIIRRMKVDVLKDLPSKTYSVVPLELSKGSASISDEDLEGSLATIRDRIDALKSSAYALKRDSAIAWVEEFLESGEKLVLFAYHRVVVEDLLSHFGRERAVEIYGGMDRDERERNIRKFVRGKKWNLLIGNIIAAGVGIDGLQDVCSNGAFVEFAWSPTDHQQAEDRLHRIGQETPVTIHYLVGAKTIDEDLMAVLDDRRNTISKLIDGKGMDEGDMLSGLLKLKRKK